MGKYQDDIGVWNQLGIIRPHPFNWQKYPIPSDGSLATMRLTIQGANLENINSVLWIRSRFTTAKTDQITPAIKIFPKTYINDSGLIHLPISNELLERSIYIRSIEIKKYVKPLRGIGTLNDVDYVVKLDELWSV